MAIIPPASANPLIKSSLFRVFFTIFLSSFFFILGSYTISTTTSTSSSSSSPLLHDHSLHCSNPNFSISPPLQFSAHHTLPLPPEPPKIPNFLDFCSENFTNYCPCHDPSRENGFPAEKKFDKERHCPEETGEGLRCLIPAPVRYRRPVPWPKSREFVWFSNVPFPRLTVYKKSQNWVRLERDRLVFPGGGTSFRQGVKGYVEEIKKVVPLASGSIRTVLDVGCGVASFGASLMDYNILTMSIAPIDNHEAQVQFALERGLPAMLGILSIHRLPYPSRSFDMAHCSRCLVPWTQYGGLYLMEIDRVLRPGGYWILSGPPINWKVTYKDNQSQAQDFEKEQISLEDLARRMCWKKVAERGPIAVWRKPTNHIHCIQKLKLWKSIQLCVGNDPDASWYKKMDPCITPLPNVTDIHAISGGALQKWPKRLMSTPPRITSDLIKGITVKTFHEDTQLWRKRVSHYHVVLKSLKTNKYRNIMDMNAGIGSFAAALVEFPVWVMNVVPFDAEKNTLGVVFERGLIGTYMNWCEAFSTYPRTYDLIHAYSVFSMYIDKCDIIDILLELQRILRPHGTVIIRDHVDIIVKVKDITDKMRWNAKIFHSENGPFHPEKILLLGNSQ
ncbi:hypothetical protein FEM48_Zijuj07G0029800 [Ziziphus jujuba var. spinosa]|uniref:Methyltransferase n=1 Tax=Ziziphus jujuba var. spinosa TaxID=714518 RepID=A0A978V225_ZIZJJ|nr:hypothetical protein FEM48_Zijuj07G0029800 [Ziziphus jujuba var. spinosa]